MKLRAKVGWKLFHQDQPVPVAELGLTVTDEGAQITSEKFFAESEAHRMVGSWNMGQNLRDRVKRQAEEFRADQRWLIVYDEESGLETEFKIL